MNIHFDNKEIFEELKRLSLFKIKIGSWMYGTNDENSDEDILYIYYPSLDEMNSLAASHHQYQYKEDNIDHIFTDIFTFLKNSLSGDSTINFEILNDSSLNNSKLDFIYEMRKSFHNYKIIRSYLGLARRDLKFISKCKNDREKNKKLNHILRGYNFCLDILNDKFNPKIDKESELYKEIIENKSITDSKIRHEKGKKLKELISLTRNEVNNSLDNNSFKFPHYINFDDLKKLDFILKIKMKEWKNEFGESDYFEKLDKYVYDAISNGITYNGDEIYKIN